MTDAIATTDTDLHQLQRLVNDARPSSTTVKVPKEALRRLLLDHHTLYTTLRERGRLVVTAGADQRSLL